MDREEEFHEQVSLGVETRGFHATNRQVNTSPEVAGEPWPIVLASCRAWLST